MDRSLTVNRASWDDRAPLHAESPDYRVDQLVGDPEALSGVVRFDRDRLGDLTGLRVVHLQCHLGTDTLSLHRLGARVTGLDFSPASLEHARSIAARAGAEIDYVEADVQRADEVLPRHAFDVVYTGIGALCWLPSIERWAAVVAALLAPGGRLLVRDMHPLLGALDEHDLSLRYPYFETAEPVVSEEDTSYVPTSRPLSATVTHSWNHGIGEIVTALLGQGLTVTALAEHASVPWEALPGRMAEGDDGEWRVTGDGPALPLSVTVQAVAP
ncbi:SAM-dependent methyltransferase [Pseudonocardia sp. Ae168_Ps1]|uniref:class I SAM-dependent methyltransferase n=1 Tax=unclassified Pseudonocardia TaxID=2619320 RepID=UPI00030E3C01|nr:MULTISPECIES: class I SAM-dependent methyltransferase [unclassified Pseudonocardia]OLL74576.1 SAM-dependent methyltransferase [Pseudonocardia sp. Ae150A_Ps1]OLL80555.1 SAM-dependent methyltransferase [Pseudonocardia sp. Ae168_Ps1]OLL85315.1 SAM-dependent methyltransferase [Pseudonocardia sp. Ae263_Ps1]OLL94658.1 SAM-dependent methyltransferase [Pseudonocardia sp. Ae356_Ps1]OLM21078.1 SAM-dependent methyltransferase [Pseudonocardia sp. Ae707_Ps1]